MGKGEWFKLERKRAFDPISSPFPPYPDLRPVGRDGIFLYYKSKLQSTNIIVSLAPSLTWQAWKKMEVYILKKKTSRLAHVLFGQRMTLPGDSIVMQFLYGVGGYCDIS